MKDKIRNQIEKVCPYCGSEVIISELNAGSPCRNYDSASCPNCGKKIHEDYIVGEFVAKLKIIDEVFLKEL